MTEPTATPSATADSDAHTGDAGSAWARPMLERQLQMLGELAEMGLNVARAIERQAVQAGAETGVQDIALAYARASRAVRMTIALQAKLIGALQALEQRAPFEARWAEILGEAARNDHPRRARIERIARRIIKAEHPDQDQVERLADEAAERLDDQDLYGDVLSRPISEVVALICRDLGLSPDWPRLAQEAWALEEIAGGVPGWPLAEWAGKTAENRRPPAATAPFWFKPPVTSPEPRGPAP